MPVTTLDPKTALIIIDLQNGIVELPAVHPIAEVVTQAAALAGAFRQHGLPVVLVTVISPPSGRTERASNVTHFPAGWADLVPELNRQPGDHTVAKQAWGAFTNTDLEPYLKSRGVTQVVIAGIATSIGVESTARHARELGFNVTLATDAMTDRDPDAHFNSVTRIFPRLGETGATQEIMDILDSELFDKARA